MRLFFVLTLFIYSMASHAMGQENVETSAAFQQKPICCTCITQYRTEETRRATIYVALHAYKYGVGVEKRIHYRENKCGQMDKIRIDFMNYLDAVQKYGSIRRPHE